MRKRHIKAAIKKAVQSAPPPAPEPSPSETNADDKVWVTFERTYQVAPYQNLKVQYGCSKTIEPGADHGEVAEALSEEVLHRMRRMVTRAHEELV